jgi:hypothetical protein
MPLAQNYVNFWNELSARHPACGLTREHRPFAHSPGESWRGRGRGVGAPAHAIYLAVSFVGQGNLRDVEVSIYADNRNVPAWQILAQAWQDDPTRQAGAFRFDAAAGGHAARAVRVVRKGVPLTSFANPAHRHLVQDQIAVAVADMLGWWQAQP